MRRFAFLVHPRDRADIDQMERQLPESETDRIKSDWCAFEYIQLSYEEAHGSVVVAPLTTAQMERLPTSFLQAKVLEAAELAIKGGAEIIGLGAMTSVVTWSGRWLAPRVDALVTNGNTLTAAVVAQQVHDIFGRELAEHRIAIIGAGGSVGFACAQLLGPGCKDVLLVGRSRKSLKLALKQLDPNIAAEMTTQLGDVSRASIVILATASSAPILFAQHIRPHATVFDLTEPSNLSHDARESGRAGRFSIYRAGRVRAKGIDLTRMDRHMPRDTAYACLGESLVYALDERFVDHGVERPSVEKLTSMLDAARRLGIEPDLECD